MSDIDLTQVPPATVAAERSATSRLERLDPLLTLALCGHGALVLAGGASTGSWAVLALVTASGVAGLLGWRGTTAASCRAVVLCVAATMLADPGGAASGITWWYPAVVAVYGVLVGPTAGMGVTVIACCCHLAAMGAPGATVTADAVGGLALLAAVGAVVWRAATLHLDALSTCRRLATSDVLTGLPNRAVLLDHLDLALARTRRTPSPVAVVYLDLDDFKSVNDSLGHEVGDELLTEVARRLARALRPTDTVARFGGDEFVVLCEDLPAPRAVVAVAERIRERLAAPLRLRGRDVVVSASLGIAVHTGGDRTSEELLHDADAAMYSAKARGGGCYEIFDVGMREAARVRLKTEAALHRAVANDELHLVYQPQVRLSDDRVVGYEALLRWRRDDGEHAVAPLDFIPLAEETGLIVPIGEWVINEACRHAARWQREGRDQWVSVNVSPRQLGDPRLCREVARALADSGLHPSRLCLEITETAAMQDLDRALDVLGCLRQLGVAIHIDDFGTGCSSLSTLGRFPVTGLKVDRSFVAELATAREGSAITTAIITVAHALGMPAVAEGVETAEQLAMLRDLGCDFAQGYHLGRPERQGGQEMPSQDALALQQRARDEESRLGLLLAGLREERRP